MRNKKATIGLIIEIEGTVDIEGYKTSLRDGVTNCAKDNDCNLLCFAGGSWKRSPYGFNEDSRNKIYHLISNKIVDGLICVFTVTSYADKNEKNNFFKLIKGIPIVSVGAVKNDIPYVTINNISGMTEIVEHLIIKHNYSKIAFIGGPKNNPESNERLNAYKDILKKHGISFNPKLVVNGDFLSPSGTIGVKTLLEKRKVRIDSIVAANDHMAFGAIRELKRRGISVPREISVVGFDNSIKSEVVIPALSTVNQPVFEMGYEAVLQLLKILKNEKIKKKKEIPSRLVIRQSCGCYVSNIANLKNLYEVYNSMPGKKIKISLDKIINDLLEKYNDIGINKNELKDIVKTFHENFMDLKSGNIILLDYIIDFISSKQLSKKNLIQWKDLFTEMQILFFNFNLESRVLYRMSIFFQQTKLLICDFIRHSEFFEKLEHDTYMENLQILSRKMFSSFTLDNLIEVIEENINILGVKDIFIIFYDKFFSSDESVSTTELPEIGRLIFAMNDYIRIDQDKNQSRYFNIKNILPECILKKINYYNWVVEPLFIDKYQFGYFIISQSVKEGLMYENLRSMISTTIYAIFLMERRDKAEESLKQALNDLEISNQKLLDLSIKDELTNLYNRRGFFLHGERYMAMAVRNNKPFVVFYTDLDDFKIINDTYGHSEGDNAIYNYSKILSVTFRDADLICRMGGDEFVVLSYNCDKDFIDNIESRLVKSINEYNNESNKPYKLSVSFGVSNYDPENPEVLDAILHDADRKLYKMKKKRKRKK